MPHTSCSNVHVVFVRGFRTLSTVNIETTRRDDLVHPVLVVKVHRIVGVHAMAAYVAIVIRVVRVAVRGLQFLYNPEYVFKSCINTIFSPCVVIVSDEL